MSGKLIVIVAPSGAGKSTLIKKLKEEFPQLKESVSYTTRPIRQGEVEGKSYFYIDLSTFQKMKDQSEFLEWAQVHSNYYGTSKKFVEEGLKRGDDLLFDLDVQGADSFKEYFGARAKAIFIAPPNLDTLRSRLRGRGTENTQVINLRLFNASSELDRKNDYDYLVLNDEFEVAYSELKRIVLEILSCTNT